MPEVGRERGDALLDVGTLPVPLQKASTSERVTEIVDARASSDRRVGRDDIVEQSPHHPMHRPIRERLPGLGHEECGCSCRRRYDRVAAYDVASKLDSRGRMQRDEPRFTELGPPDREHASLQVGVRAPEPKRFGDPEARTRE